MPKISIDDIATTAKTALIKHGADESIALHVARAVAQAESVGNRICGLYYLESYCVQLQSGRVRGDVTPAVSQPIVFGCIIGKVSNIKTLPFDLRAIRGWPWLLTGPRGFTS